MTIFIVLTRLSLLLDYWDYIKLPCIEFLNIITNCYLIMFILNLNNPY